MDQPELKRLQRCADIGVEKHNFALLPRGRAACVDPTGRARHGLDDVNEDGVQLVGMLVHHQISREDVTLTCAH